MKHGLAKVFVKRLRLSTRLEALSKGIHQGSKHRAKAFTKVRRISSKKAFVKARRIGSKIFSGGSTATKCSIFPATFRVGVKSGICSLWGEGKGSVALRIKGLGMLRGCCN
ncbi:hypothetical protein AMTR_s00099p00039670 [Amborella trichopoda]|uniref:Uncharacterized protein n=1 Tax=Amborella trichopoda TaxID=13333 RepID=W1NWN2_AMBTC|nr:hypothetical protein AMTR_s00099p00039670 [Amborella trichopoda]